METQSPAPRRGTMEMDPAAPVAGGMRWRGHRHAIADWCRQAGGFTVHDPDAPLPGKPYQPEPGLSGAPSIVSTPPEEARVGEEYIYQARACDAVTDGFTWYFEKSAPGMAVDRHTGRVSWTPTEGGYAEVVLCARSVYGPASRQSWTVCVRKAAVREPIINTRFREALLRKGERSLPPVRVFRCEARKRNGATGRATAPPARRLRAALPLRR